ncbi:MFS general substrate transporter [Violaceomyces palustris]|uniref:MFS general substrate transporter n=1 Tax=Violaceomyces palustris TaxID=1673888 RepID=A0ACD0NVD0_9BASI|nr:MFS general substrate transporter [Violaceomyces palustris]
MHKLTPDTPTRRSPAPTKKVLYVPYIIFEIPSNLLIKKVGPARWIPGLVTVWGIVSTLQGIVTTKTGLYIVRAFLGFAEAGILPGIALYLTFFYKPHEIHLRQALYFSGSSLSGAFSGLLSTAIGKMDGLAGLRGWSWIFILEGIFTVLFGVLCLWILPNGPNKLWWVTPAERQLATSRMETTTFDSTSKAAGSGMGSEAKTEDAAAITTKDKHDLTDRQFVFKELLRTFTDPLVLLFCASGYTYATGLYSLAFFSPSIIKSLDNYTAVQAQLLSAPPNAVAFVVSVAVAVASDRFKWRYPAAMFCIILAIIGFAVTYASMTPSVRYGGIIILSSGIYSIPPVGISWMLNNTASHYKRACSIALYIVFTNSGGITSNWLFNDNEAPRYKRGFLVNLALCSLSAVIVTLAELYIMWEKKQRKLGKRDWRVNELRAKGWDEEKIRVYLGDRHPNYELTL